MTFLANFTAADGTLLSAYTADSGDTFSAVFAYGGNPKISSNKLYEGGAGSGWYKASGNAASANCSYEATIVKQAATPSSSTVAIGLRCNIGGTAGYYLQYQSSVGWQWWTAPFDSNIAIGSPVTQTLTVGSVYKVKIEASGTTLKFYTDNADGTYVLRQTLTDTSYSTVGAPGIAFANSSGTLATSYLLDSFTEIVTATAITFTGPSSGTNGSASTNFSVGANGSITGTVVVTPSSNGGGGTFSPTTVSISNASPTGTFTYTPASTGAKDLSVSNNGSLSNPSHISYTSNAAAATAATMTGPNAGTTGIASPNFTAGANGTITGTVVCTPSDGGAGGAFSPTTVSINTASPTGTFTYIAASNGTKTISLANNGSLGNPSTISYVASAAASVAAGTVSFVSASATTINMTCTAATGGSGGLTYQWYRGIIANFVVNSGSLLTGATSLTLADSTSLSADVPYWYICRVTDGGGNTSDSRSIPGVLQAPAFVLGFIGDSITSGWGLSAGQDPASQIVSILSKLYKNRTVTVVNRAVPTMRTDDWLSGGELLATAKAAFAAAGATHVNIMLGVNDAATNSASTYKSNLQNIIADLTGAGYKIVLCYPTFLTYAGNGSYATTYSATLGSYLAQIDSLVNGSTVLRGDVLAYNYFITHQNELQSDGIHLLPTGTLSLATMWARAFDRNVFGMDKPPYTRTVTCTFKNAAGSLKANMTGLNWVWSDIQGQPIDSGTGATTNASGVFTITVHTYLAAAGVGYLTVTNAAGVVNTTYVSFSGPAVAT